MRHLITAIIKHNIGSLAAVIAFFGFSAMIPLFFLLVYGASILIPNHLIEKFFIDVFASYVPTIPEAKSFLPHTVARLVSLSPETGIFSLFGLLWTTIGGFVSLQQMLDIIWESRHRRSFIFQYLVGFGMLGILLLLTIISSLATVTSPMLLRIVFMNDVTVQWLSLIHVVSRISLPILLFATCYFCYRLLPSYILRNSYLLIGAMVSTIGVYASRQIFVWYTEHLGRYELIYGSLTFIMLFTFWVYIVSIILLFGGEVAVTLQSVLKPQAVK